MKLQSLIGIAILSQQNGFALTHAVPSEVKTSQIKTLICDAYAGETKTVTSPDCMNGIFYDSDSTRDESEVSMILQRQSTLTICKFYVTKSLSESNAVLDGCQYFEAPKSCSQTVRNAVAVALAQSFPAVAGSFSIERIKYQRTLQNKRFYEVATTDEVENERWTVQALGNKYKCTVKSVKYLE